MRLENRPPSAVFITCAGRKSVAERAAPIIATRSCVCGAPGRSTITTFDGDVRRRRQRRPRRRAALPGAERLLRQRPQLGHRDVAGDDQRRVVRHEVLLPERRAADRAVIAFNDAAVPSSAKPYGCASPYSTLATIVRRQCLRRSRAVAPAVRDEPCAAARARRPGTTDCSATSASLIERRGKILLERSRADRRRVHGAGRRQRARPAAPMSSAICSALRVVVPWVSIAAAKFARPGASAGLAVAAGLDHEIRRHHRQAAARRQHHRQPVGERDRLRRRHLHVGARGRCAPADPSATARRR